MAVGDRRPQAPLIRKIRRLAQFQAVKKPIGERERIEALSRFHRSRRHVRVFLQFWLCRAAARAKIGEKAAGGAILRLLRFRQRRNHHGSN